VGEQFASEGSPTSLGISPSVYLTYNNGTVCLSSGQYVIALGDGSIFAVSSFFGDGDCDGDRLSRLVVTGGTGAYAGVRGVVDIDGRAVIKGTTTFDLRR
jgi:hypothetical protein